MNDEVPKKIANSEEDKRYFEGTDHQLCKLKAKISRAWKSSEDVVLVKPVLREQEDNEDEGGKRCDIAIEGDDESLDDVVGIGILKIVLRILQTLVELYLKHVYIFIVLADLDFVYQPLQDPCRKEYRYQDVYNWRNKY